MADVTINSDTAGNDYQHGTHTLVCTDQDTVYQFYVDADDGDLYYEKSTDGGATWGCPVSIQVGTTYGFDVWAEHWTNGSETLIIHIVFLQSNGSAAHKRLDANTDTLSSSHTVPALGQNVDGPSRFVQSTSVVKARGGNVYVYMGGTEAAGCGFASTFAVSTDNGDTFTAKASPGEDTGTGRIDRVCLMPGAEADTDDIIALYYDDSAQEWSLKTYDQSLDTWTCGTSIATGIDLPLSIHRGFDAMPRHSDDHTIVYLYDINTAFTDMDILVYDIIDECSITAKTNILTAGAYAVGVGAVIDQQSDDLYAFYADTAGTDINAVDVFYVKSTDGGTTWGCPVAYSEGCAAVHHEYHAPVSLGTIGGRVACAFSERGGESLLYNKVNSVAISGTPFGAVVVSNILAKMLEFL